MVRTSQYHVLHHFTTKLHEAFLRAGFLSEIRREKNFLDIEKDSPDMTVGFNGAPRDKNTGTLLYDEIHIPHLSLLVDPPFRFFYLTKSSYSMIGCDDRAGCQLLNLVDFKKNFFLPHAVEPELTFDPKEERPFDVVMLATFIDHEERRKNWKTKFPPSIRKVMDDAIEMTFSDPALSFIAALDKAFVEDQLLHPQVPFEGVSLIEVFEEIEIYIKGRDRAELIKSVPDSTVHIFGSQIDQLDWKRYLGTNHPNIEVHGAVNYPQALEIMKKSKVLLNPSIKNKAGAHERIFAGLACGAVVITNESAYLRETFEDGQGLNFYTSANRNSLNDQVQDFLSNEKKRIREAELGREITMKHHTWDNRVETIMLHVPSYLKSIPSFNL